MSDHPNIWTDGSREDFSSVGGFEVAGAVVYLLASEVAAFESAVWGVPEGFGMLVWSVAVLLHWSLGRYRLFSVPNSGHSCLAGLLALPLGY